jgi:hypothetical protein
MQPSLCAPHTTGDDTYNRVTRLHGTVLERCHQGNAGPVLSLLTQKLKLEVSLMPMLLCTCT